MGRRRWTAADLTTMKAMRLAGANWHEISAAVDHPAKSCECTFYNRFGSKPQERTERRQTARYESISGPTSHRHREKHNPAISQLAELSRIKREEARERMSFTSQFFGDPPPGYSALDRRRA